MGNDSGGSIRIPSAWCGLTGLKPTHGRVSLRGNLSCEWSTTAVGPLCRSVADAAFILQAIAGYDADDPMSRREPVPDYLKALQSNTRRFRVGIPRRLFADGLDSDHSEAFAAAVDVLRQRVAQLRDIELPPVRQSIGYDTMTEFYREHEPYITKSPELIRSRKRGGRLKMGTGESSRLFTQPIRNGRGAARDPRCLRKLRCAGLADHCCSHH